MKLDEAAGRLQRLAELADAFSPDSAVGLTLSWENEHGEAGVNSFEGETFVYLFHGQAKVRSLAEAAQTLSRIFSGDIVAVRAFADEQVIYTGLAPASDPGATINEIDPPVYQEKSRIDFVQVESWSRGLLETD